MSLKKINLNNSLLLRGNTWHIHWNVPRTLRSNPYFKGKKIYAKTLQTKDVFEARKMRDLLVSKFRQIADISATHEARCAFMVKYKEASDAVEVTKKALVYVDGEKAFNAWDALESAFTLEKVIEKETLARADACLTTTPAKPDLVEPAPMTLHAVTEGFVKDCEGTVAPNTLRRAKIAAANLLKTLGDRETKLKDVTSRQVTRWINSISGEIADNTRKGYLGALHKMWHWAWENEHVDGISPFKGISMQRQGDEASYEPFTPQEVQEMAGAAQPDLLTLIQFGLITGCRIGELVGLTSASFIVVEGIHSIQIKDGKTEAATRVIPLPSVLWATCKQYVEAGAWSGTRSMWSQRFSALKMKVTGKKDRTKGFHSFRHMTATAYERAHIEERITSVLLGHKNKRGESMSYGLYSAGLAPKQYLEAVETMLAGEYMSQFLKLCNK